MNKLVEFLKRNGYLGREKAIRRKDVAGWLGVSVRDVKAFAEAARLEGIPVLFSTDAKRGGIFLASGEAEIENGIDKLTRLALSLLRERSSLKRALKKRRERVEQKQLWG